MIENAAVALPGLSRAPYGGSLGQKVPMTKSPCGNAHSAPSHNLYGTHENSIPFLHRDLAGRLFYLAVASKSGNLSDVQVFHGHASHGRHLTGCASHGRVSHGRVPHGRAPHRRVPYGRASRRRASHGRVPHGRAPHRRAPHRRASHKRVPHGVYLIGVYLKDMHLTGVHLMGVYLIDVYLMGMHLIYESSLRAGHGWRESLYRHQGCFKASDCGRLGRQAAGHPWSALRVVKSCRKDCPTAKVLLEAKAAALHPKRYQSLLSKLSTREVGEAGKRSAGNRIS